MTSRGTEEFWRLYNTLSPEVKAVARDAYRRLLVNPAHPGLQLERLKIDPRIWSVRITRNWRAVARRHEDTWLWFWIGSHEEFDRRFPR